MVATPGRFWALAESAAPGSYLDDWTHLHYVVVDETDRMVEKGHFEELQHIIDRIKRFVIRVLLLCFFLQVFLEYGLLCRISSCAVLISLFHLPSTIIRRK